MSDNTMEKSSNKSTSKEVGKVIDEKKETQNGAVAAATTKDNSTTKTPKTTKDINNSADVKNKQTNTENAINNLNNAQPQNPNNIQKTSENIDILQELINRKIVSKDQIEVAIREQKNIGKMEDIIL